jgi:hypothetical protein
MSNIPVPKHIKGKIYDMYNKGESIEHISNEVGKTKMQVEAFIQYSIKNNRIEKRYFSKEKQGENHNRAKLSENDVIDIYNHFLLGEKAIDIFNKNIFNTTHGQIIKIINGKSWEHLYENYSERIIAEKKRKKKFSASLRKQFKKAKKGEVINYPTALCPQCGNPYPCEHTA